MDSAPSTPRTGARSVRSSLTTGWPWHRAHCRLSTPLMSHHFGTSHAASSMQQPAACRDGGLSMKTVMTQQRTPASLTLASFKLQELPWHSKVLQQARVQSEVAFETAVSHAEDALDETPARIHAAVLDFQRTLQQAIANLLAWIDFLRASRSSSSSTQAQHAAGEDSSEATMQHAAVHSVATVATSHGQVPLATQEPVRQMHCSVSLSEQPIMPVSGLVSMCRPLHVLGALVALLLAVGLPRMWRRHWEEVEQRRQIQQVMEMNALALRKQKQRFQQALQVDSINLDLPDIKDAAVDPSKAELALQTRPPGPDAMRQEWESFMMASKSGQVKNVWDAKAQADTGAPRASRKQLEEMTARVRAAASSPETGKRRYVSFEDLCMQDEDFDAGMAERVAQRKARFQGQFLSDEDVGMEAPKRPSAPGNKVPPLNLAGIAPGNGRLGAPPAGTGGAGGEDIAARRKRLGLGEGRGGGDRSARAVPMSGADAPLLEIRPKRTTAGSTPAEHRASAGSGSARPAPTPGADAPLLEIRPKRTSTSGTPAEQPASVGPAGASSSSAASTQPPAVSGKASSTGPGPVLTEAPAGASSSPRGLPKSGVNTGTVSSSNTSGSAPGSPVRRLSADAGAGIGKERLNGSSIASTSSSTGASGSTARTGVTPQGALRLGLNGASPEINDSELQQSLLLRGQLHYVHPSVAGTVAGAQAQQQQQQRITKQGSMRAAGTGSATTSGTPNASLGTNRGSPANAGSSSSAATGGAAPGHAPTADTRSGPGLTAPAAATAQPMEELTADDAAQTIRSKEDADEALYLPVSGVSLGLLRGASRIRKANERAETSDGKAAAHDNLQVAAVEAAPQPAEPPKQKEEGQSAKEPKAAATKALGAVDALLQLMRRPLGPKK